MVSFKDKVLPLTLSNQYLLRPGDSIQEIVKNLGGIQVQYFNHAIHALKQRYKGEINEEKLADGF